MATVYKAYQSSLDRYVAVKVLGGQLARDATFRGRFEKEAKAVAKLSHPNILQVHDSGEQDGMAYIVTEFIDGGSLKERLGQPLDFGIAARIGHEIALALDHAHRQGIYHRDVKPGNILLSQEGRSLLADFGIVKMYSETQLTETGMTVGTAAYMSPEQARGEEVDGRSDLYSLGIVIYEMLTGRSPFRADTPLAVLHQQVFNAPPPPRDVNPGIPRRLERVLLKSLAKQPDGRFRTGRDMAAALSKAVKFKSAEELPAALPDQAATVAVAPPVSTTGRRLLRTAEKGAAGVGKGTLRLTGRLAWFILRVAAVILLAVVILGIAAGVGGTYMLSSFAERIIPSYDQQLRQFQAFGQTFTVSESDMESGVSAVILPYTLDIVQDVSFDFSPPDSATLAADVWDRPVQLEGRVVHEGDYIGVYVERLNGLPLYVVGGILSRGINRGIAELFDRASFRLDLLEIGEAGIELRAAGNGG
jgi:hypothetical protein